MCNAHIIFGKRNNNKKNIWHKTYHNLSAKNTEIQGGGGAENSLVLYGKPDKEMKVCNINLFTGVYYGSYKLLTLKLKFSQFGLSSPGNIVKK